MKKQDVASYRQSGYTNPHLTGGPNETTEAEAVKGAGTITATYVWRPDRKKFRVLVRPAKGPRLTRHVRTEQDAIDLVRHFNRLGMSVAGTARIMEEYGLKETQMGLVYSAFLLFYTLAMLPGGWFIDRFGARAALMVLTFGSAIFVALTGCGLPHHGQFASTP